MSKENTGVVHATYGSVQSMIYRLHTALGDKGLEFIDTVNADQAYVNRIAAYILADAPDLVQNASAKKPSLESEGTSYRVAVAIMGQDKVLGAPVFRKYLEMRRSNAAVPAVKSSDYVPYAPETLARCKDTHVLVHGQDVQLTFFNEGIIPFGVNWLKPEVGGIDSPLPLLMTTRPPQKWYLISRQAKQLAAGERIATAAEIVFALGLHKFTNRNRNFYLYELSMCHESDNGVEMFIGGDVDSGAGRVQGHLLIKRPPPNIRRSGGYVTIVEPDAPLA